MLRSLLLVLIFFFAEQQPWQRNCKAFCCWGTYPPRVDSGNGFLLFYRIYIQEVRWNVTSAQKDSACTVSPMYCLFEFLISLPSCLIPRPENLSFLLSTAIAKRTLRTQHEASGMQSSRGAAGCWRLQGSSRYYFHMRLCLHARLYSESPSQHLLRANMLWSSHWISCLQHLWIMVSKIVPARAIQYDVHCASCREQSWCQRAIGHMPQATSYRVPFITCWPLFMF